MCARTTIKCNTPVYNQKKKGGEWKGGVRGEETGGEWGGIGGKERGEKEDGRGGEKREKRRRGRREKGGEGEGGKKRLGAVTRIFPQLLFMGSEL